MTAANPISSQIDDDRADWLNAQLVEFNTVHGTSTGGGGRPAEPLQLYLTGASGDVLAGLIGRTNAVPSWLEVSVLWVADAERRRGHGSQLMARAEQIARDRGCQYARLSTSNFQAPEFYPRLGYQLYGTLPEYPPGEIAYYFLKSLG